MAAKGPLWYVFVGSRGGDTRICIVESILAKPKNPRQIALELDVDYSTVTHSLRVLEKNRIVYTGKRKYGAPYMATPEFEAMRAEFERIREKHVCMKRKVKA
jgi:predicted MarR family transcription regulator